MSNHLSGLNLRSERSTPLPYTDVDANFNLLNDGKVSASGGDLVGGTIENTTIGAVTRSSGKFTTLDANGNVILGDASGDTVTVKGTVTPATSSAVGLLVAGTSTGAMLKITQEGTGDVFVVEDVASDSTPFKIDNAGNVTIAGNLTVDGTTTTINSTTLDIDDLNITVAKGAANAAAADGAGITVDGASATFTFANTGTNWASSENLSLASGKAYKINNVEVLSASALTIGSLGYSAAGAVASLTSSVAGYNQLVVRNTNTGATASSDIVVNNDNSTDSTYYGDFGMNSAAWSGTGFSTSNAVYLTATTVPLMLGTTTNNNLEIWVGATSTQALSIAGSTGITTISQLLLTTKLAVAQGGTGGSSAGISLFNNITGYSAAGATGTTSTNLVFSTSPVLTTPTLAATPAQSATGTGVATVDYVHNFGGFSGHAVYNTTGALSSTLNALFGVPAGITKVKITVIGAGGGGGGVTAVTGAAGGGGGGSVGTYYFTNISSTQAITGSGVGAGGTAGANTGTAGGTGGSTQFIMNSVTLTAPGGSGGAGVTVAATAGVGGAGGTIATQSGGTASLLIAFPGAPGGNGSATATVTNNQSGFGGGGYMGGGGAAGRAAVTNAGIAGGGFGGGASGALGASAQTGAAGANGAIICEW